MAASACQQVALGWDANPDPSVAGYAVYYGTNSGNYTTRIDAGTNIAATVYGLTEGITYYFAVTSYSAGTVGSSLLATPFITNTSLGTLRTDASGFLGMEFVVGANPLIITALGRMMESGNSGTHTVKLVNAGDGLDVPGGIVSVSMGGGTVGQFQYATLSSPVTLAAQNAYYLMSEETMGGDSWCDFNTSVGTTAVAMLRCGAWGHGPGAWWTYGTVGESFGPVDFQSMNASSSVTNAESAPSREVSYTVPGRLILTASGGANASPTLNFPVAAGHWYEIQATTDLQNWSTIGQTALATTNAWTQYQDVQDEVVYQQRFYRLVMH